MDEGRIETREKSEPGILLGIVVTPQCIRTGFLSYHEGGRGDRTYDQSRPSGKRATVRKLVIIANTGSNETRRDMTDSNTDRLTDGLTDSLDSDE
jgi:hypothetical protein